MTSRNTFFSRTSGTDSFFGNPKKTAVRPITPESFGSEDSEDKLTRQQHACINNLGMAAAFFLPMALIAAAVGMGTGYWFNIQHYYVGLFQRCDNWTQICQSVSNFYDENDTDKMKTTWTIGVPLLFTGIAVFTIALMALVCYPCHRKINFSKIACAVTIGVILLLGFLTFAGGFALFALYAASNTNSATMMWSFYCAIGGVAFGFIATILFWVHMFYTGCFE
ncbi:uncharacterized protein LOC123539688 [Mercenaria mercenaria]|uniref:uncharacterized protein LOC123539688 n=1 Tax=Mercenaria mercenaria TaxID=6596 RepID=UPI00234ED1DE|nr:uncharacterized protein LOC123539688 [Mercenaria mercenaria]